MENSFSSRMPIDPNDAGIEGGTQDTITPGVNYCPIATVRFMLN